MQVRWFWLLASCVGCVGPLVSDEPGLGAVLAAGTAVPGLADNPVLATRLQGADGVGPLVPLLSGFRGGTMVHYWDFGPATATLATMFVLVDDAGGRLPHPPILADAPGDSRYSPFFRVYAIRVTSSYAGQVIPSVDALEDAENAGLVESEPMVIGAVDAPVLGADVKLARTTGAPTAPTTSAYYRGVAVPQESLAAIPISQFGSIRSAARYVLHRSGEEPISEAARGVDITGDGDRFDTNDVMGLAANPPGAAMPSPVCQTVNVVVASSMRGIDSNRNEGSSDVTDATQLFAPGPVTPLVVAFTATSEVRNCPPAP